MSFHELAGDYPWLSKRMARIDAVASGEKIELPRRHFFAWMLALFVPRTGAGASGGVINGMIVVAVIGILAAIAVPSYMGYVSRAQVDQAWQVGQDAQQKLEDYIIEHGELPANLEQIGFKVGDRRIMATYSMNNEGAIVITFTGAAPIAGKTLLIQPYIENERLYWHCQEGTLGNQQRPQECRSEE